MGKAAILASGNGSNFEAIVHAVEKTPHTVCCLICDRRDAYVFERARKLGVPHHYVSYAGKDRRSAEEEIESILSAYGPNLIVLAGFMRLLTPRFVDTYHRKIVNIHPSLLPKYPGRHGIRESFESNDRKLGITIHYVDHGTDTGEILKQVSFTRTGNESLQDIETRIHELEHTTYPEVVVSLLDGHTVEGRFA